MLRKVKWHTEIIVPCNVSARCAEMTRAYDIVIGLWQFVYMCKAEKTQLNERIAIGSFFIQRTVTDKVLKMGTENWLCFKGN